MSFESTKIIDLGSCAFRQWRADHSHCKFIHGYRLVAKFWFSCSELDEKNWVVDFGNLKELKIILEKQFDHTLCVAADDPLLPYFTDLHKHGGCDLRIMPEGVGIEKTAEWCFKAADEYVRRITSNRCWTSKVEVWEHEKNSALYVGNITPCKEELTSKQEPVQQEPVQQEPVQQEPVQQEPGNEPIPARIGNQVSSGWSNPFAGTSWGV
jgi:6-pyruvoyltetrahydropterin/6-carboxytetrahydropterin synthase